MTKPLASLFAATLALSAAPALAQHHPDGPPPRGAPETWEGEWQGDWEDEDTYRGVWHGTYTGLDGVPVEGEYRGVFIGESRFVSDEGRALHREERRGWREERSPPSRSVMGRPLPPQVAPRFAYSPAERAAWIDECRARVDDYGYAEDRRGQRRGTAIGGILGAIGGGFAGNRIAGRGDRAVGAVLGAGVGAVAGAAIGGAIGADGDRRRGPDGPLDQCEAYLAQYETSAQGPAYAYGYPGAAYGPVMMIRVPIYRERARDCGCTEVIEEIVEDRPAPRPARRAMPRPAPSKRVRR